MKCEQCDSCYINGVFCHEAGCPEQFRRTCRGCGDVFYATERFFVRNEGLCGDCSGRVNTYELAAYETGEEE